MHRLRIRRSSAHLALLPARMRQQHRHNLTGRGLIERHLTVPQHRLQVLQARILLDIGHRDRCGRGRRAGAGRIGEGISLGETDLPG